MKDEVKEQLIKAFERIINKNTLHLKRGAKLSAANVIRETGRSPDQIKISRYPSIQTRIIEEKAKINAQKKILNERASSARRTIKEQLDGARRERDKLASIVASQDEYILDLLDQIEKLKDHVVDLK